MRQHSSAEGRLKAINFAPNLVNVQREFQQLNTREARVAFVDTWLKVWAHDFEQTWPVIYRTLQWVEQEKLYQDPRAVDPNEVYPDFKSYFEVRLKKPFTLWIELEQTHRYVTKYAPELINATWGDARSKAAADAQKTDAADRANLRGGGRPPQAPPARDLIELAERGTVYNNSVDVHGLRPAGNSAAAFIRRLRKDRPDIHARVLAGELSPHAGMIEAGFRKKAPSRKRSPLDHLRRWWKKASEHERALFRKETEDPSGA